MKTLTTWLLLLAGIAHAQSPCYDFGSIPIAATWEPSPVVLGCPQTPTWPQWHLFTPAHRAPAPHVGYNPGNAQELPRILIRYRCTGFLFVPVVIERVRFLGYVVDQPEFVCR